MQRLEGRRALSKMHERYQRCANQERAYYRRPQPVLARSLRSRGLRTIQQQFPIADRLQASFRVFLKTRFEQPPDFAGRCAQVALFLYYRSKRLGEIFPLEELLAGHHFVQQDSESPDIRSRSRSL